MLQVLTRRIKRINAFTWLKIALAACVGFFALQSRFFIAITQGFDIRFLWAALAVQPLIVVGLALHSMRHVVLIGSPRVPLFTAFKAMVLAQGLNLILPARLSELIKGTYLRDYANVPLSVGISAVVLERTIDLMIVASLGVVGLMLFTNTVNHLTVTIFSLASLIILLVALHAKTPVLWVARSIPLPRISSFVERSYLHLHATVRTLAFFKALGWGVAGWSISYINIFVFLYVASNASIDATTSLLMLIFTTIGAAVPILPGGIGTYEAAGVVVLRTVGYEFNDALAMVISLHAAQLFLPLALAWVFLLTDRIGVAKLIADLRRSAPSRVQ